jgi:hypothetical protein
MGKEEKDRLKRRREEKKEKEKESARNPATHPCGCLHADGSEMMLAKCMAGESLCNQSNGNGWRCDKQFPRTHVRFGDPNSELHKKCPQHRTGQCSSAASLARQKEATAERNKLKRGTKKESERQKTKKAKQLDREVPAGDLRALLRGLGPTFRAKLAKTAQGRLYVTTMETIDAYFQMSVDERPDDCGVAVFDVELVSPDNKTGLPVSAGLTQAGVHGHARRINPERTHAQALLPR